MSKKILIATGGTGGHIYPAIALAQQLKSEMPDCQVLFVGGGLSRNKYFDPSAFDSRSISCGTFVKKSPLDILKACFKIAKGVWQSRAIIRSFKPDVAVGFGSYYSFPPMIAAKLNSVPMVLHESNSIPGKVNKLLAPFADVTGVQFPQTVSLFKAKCVEVGMPLRSGFKKGSVDRVTARRHFGLQSDMPTLLVFGGSQGAHSINTRVLAAVKLLYDMFRLQVIHIAGDMQSTEELQKNYAEMGVKACVKAFENRMDLAWQAADLVICRAGASTVAEQFEFEVPGILIPFPKAADNHQVYNAEFIAKVVRGGKMLQEKGLTDAILAGHLMELLEDKGAMLAKMRKAMEDYKKRARTQDLCLLVKQLIS